MDRLWKTFVLAATGGMVIILLLAGCGSAPRPATPAPAPAPPPTAIPPPPSSPSPTPTLPEAPPATGRALGAANLNAYCRYVGYDGAKLLSNNAQGWVCSTNSPTNIRMSTVNVTAVCRWQYGLAAIGQYADYNNPNSWYCWSIT